MESHLLQMRGLKQIARMFLTMPITLVASFTDAWIETDGRIYDADWNECRIFYRCVD